MTPKEKAEYLINKYLDITPVDYSLFDTAEQASKKATLDFQLAKDCAIILVDEMLFYTENPSVRLFHKFWQEVKQEINNL